jgi:hypothetical protein
LDKVIALAVRGFFKARNYCDIYYLKNIHIKPDISLVAKKIDDYTIDDFDKKLDAVTSSLFNENYELFTQGFRTEMKRFLADEVYAYAQKQDFIDSVFKTIQNSVENLYEQSETQIHTI